MDRQQSLLAQIVALVLHLNERPGIRAQATVGSPYHEFQLTVLDADEVEPLFVRTIGLARDDDSDVTVARVAGCLQEVVNHLQQIATHANAGGAS